MDNPSSGDSIETVITKHSDLRSSDSAGLLYCIRNDESHNEEPKPFQLLTRNRKILYAILVLVSLAFIGLVECACRLLPDLPPQKFVSDVSKRNFISRRVSYDNGPDAARARADTLSNTEPQPVSLATCTTCSQWSSTYETPTQNTTPTFPTDTNATSAATTILGKTTKVIGPYASLVSTLPDASKTKSLSSRTGTVNIPSAVNSNKPSTASSPRSTKTINPASSSVPTTKNHTVTPSTTTYTDTKTATTISRHKTTEIIGPYPSLVPTISETAKTTLPSSTIKPNSTKTINPASSSAQTTKKYTVSITTTTPTTTPTTISGHKTTEIIGPYPSLVPTTSETAKITSPASTIGTITTSSAVNSSEASSIMNSSTTKTINPTTSSRSTITTKTTPTTKATTVISGHKTTETIGPYASLVSTLPKTAKTTSPSSTKGIITTPNTSTLTLTAPTAKPTATPTETTNNTTGGRKTTETAGPYPSLVSSLSRSSETIITSHDHSSGALPTASAQSSTTITPYVSMVTTLSNTRSSSYTDASAVKSYATPVSLSIGNPSSTQATSKKPFPGGTFLTYQTYIIGAWVPILLGMIFAVPWMIMDNFFRTIEPYRQLSKVRGASAENSLFLNYTNTWVFLTPFRALSKGHWPVFLSSSSSCAAVLLVVLAPEAVYIHVPCNWHAAGGCFPYLIVFQPAARLVQSLLAIMVILTIILVFLLYRQSIPTYFDPRSIAGTTILSSNEAIVSKFRVLNPTSSYKDLTKRFHGNRYKIEPREDNNGNKCIGLYHMSDLDHNNGKSAAADCTGTDSTDFECQRDSSEKSEMLRSEFGSRDMERNKLRNSPWNRQRLIHRIFVSATLIGLIGLFIIIVYYYQLDHGNGFERFMDSQTLGIRLLFVAIGVLTKLSWTNFYEDYEQYLPYIRLERGFAPPECTILSTPHSTVFHALASFVRHKQVLAASLAVNAMLAELLTLCLPNIPYGAATPLIVFKVAAYCSIGILSIMIITAIVLLFSYPKSRLLPKEPGTIAAVLLYVCSSQMTSLFADLQSKDEKSRDRVIKTVKYSYGLGWLLPEKSVDANGNRRIGIDLDPYIEYVK